METYEKKYEEALERCREFYAKLGNKQLKEEVEDIFPELAESEDDGICRKLIAFLKQCKAVYGDGFKQFGLDIDDAIAWIEKQGDKDKLIKELGEYKVKYTREVLSQQLGKQGEQKAIKQNNDATINSNLNDYCCKVYSALHKENGGKLSFARLQHLAMDIYKWCKEQQNRAEWSEDDQSNFNELSNFILETYRTEDASRLITWLNDIKDRVQLQPKQEWSEEDEYHKRQICRILKNSGCSAKLQEKTEKWIENRLKSLRPQSQWRPSKEHLHTLEAVISDYTEQGLSYTKDSLNELYEQLKKL